MNILGNPEGVAGREQQLAELLEAVHQAQQMARALCNSRLDDMEVKLLFGRLEAVRVEVEQLRRRPGAAPFREIDPKWTGLVPWRLVPEC